MEHGQVTGSAYRPELPPMPDRIARLHVDRGYPVPWFVAWLDDDGQACRAGEGTPDFRVIAAGAVAEAHRFRRCWICDTPLGSHRAFVVGPMCAVNRISAEPPSHAECAEWSAVACPFLTRPKMERREGGLPGDAEEPAGLMIPRNPGVSLVWVTRSYQPVVPPTGGVLFRMGDPERVAWYAHGRAATRAEILDSIESGLPILEEVAERQGVFAVARLREQSAAALALALEATTDG